MARDRDLFFNKIGITHVINCSSDYSSNYFQGEGVIYKCYHLKDHVRENIECVFYDAIAFIDEAKRNNGKVYVHCV
jgi:protein-tyrosine phosphatase